ncbi:hypothetical protein AURDEDRAFT_116083 [Auricularia subglabra TFB-10046 SS5]|uniref:Uncharacterized protein n=1 Tax=Auricularia subglabra (strain TFB-10046 / SS5) TaxID=717982 RepID=J0LIS2_AURST|nr:hypothetical protein AURDEDRAFT_116083 [Auricularia subglabra TFB-10046 SS5]
MLLRDVDGVLYLPWYRDSKDDVGEFFVSPFEQIEKETGYKFEKQPYRLVQRYVRVDPETHQPRCVVSLAPKATVDPFYISFDVLWTKLNERWFDAHQRMTMWFACEAVATDAAARANAQAVWMTLPDAQDKLGTQGRRSLPDCAVLKQFACMRR